MDQIDKFSKNKKLEDWDIFLDLIELVPKVDYISFFVFVFFSVSMVETSRKKNFFHQTPRKVQKRQKQL